MGKSRHGNRPVTLDDFVCTACGLLCDDLTLEVADRRIVALSPPCPLAESFFLREIDEPASACTIDRKPAELSAAVARAAELLAAARAPLIMGLERATCEARRAAVALADRLGAFLDPTDDRGGSQSHAAVQTVGAVTATLGEVANRSDLAVYWQCDPLTTHPRHLERLAKGRVAVVDSRRTPTADAADVFVLIKPGSGFECLSTLRSLVRGVELDPEQIQRQTGVSLNAWRALAEQLKSARYPSIFHPPASRVVPDPGAPTNTDATAQVITQLIHDLHRHAHIRAVALPLGRSANAAGAAHVLTWQTGFPVAISFARGYPSYLPGEATAAALIARSEVDAALVIGADPLPHLPADAAAHLRSIPLVVLDDRPTTTLATAGVAIRTAVFGLQTAGNVYRSDGVALPLRAALTGSCPDAAAVLSRLNEALAALPAAQTA